MTKQHVLEQAMELSKQDQIDVAMDLWDSVDGDKIALDIHPVLQAELDRRRVADITDLSPPADWNALRAAQ